MFGRLGRLEEDVVVAVTVELAGGLSSRRHEVALLQVHRRDRGDRICPLLLALEDLRLRDGTRGLLRRRCCGRHHDHLIVEKLCDSNALRHSLATDDEPDLVALQAVQPLGLSDELVGGLIGSEHHGLRHSLV